MKLLFLAIPILMLASCATPQSVRTASDYEVCRIMILQPTLLSTDTIRQAEFQVRNRGIDCRRFASLIYQRQSEGLNELNKLSNDLMTTPNYGAKSYYDTQPQTTRRQTPKTSITCFLKNSSASRMYKNCEYDCMGSKVFYSVGAAEFCPASIQK
jgi:hypothetical protein